VPLGRALGDRYIRVRVAAAEALESFGDRAIEAVVPLTLGLLDDSESVRGACTRVLRILGEKAVPAMRQLLRSPDERERKAAGIAMSFLAPKTVTQKDKYALIKSLEDPDEAVKREACRALAAMGHEAGEAVPALEALISDGSITEETRDEASKALKKISGR
jgi:HEAT repeat protein